LVRILVPAVVFVAALSLGAGVPRGAPLRVVGVARTESLDAPAAASCPPRTLPDGDVCVRLPTDDDAPELEASPNAHRDVTGRWTAYDEIPRRPDRPASYDAYRYPVACEHDCVVSGFDLDRPDAEQRRRRGLKYVGHGAVDLPQPTGTPIVEVPLERQQGAAEVVYVGPFFGTTIITRRTLREGGLLRDYLVLYGHLSAEAPGLKVGSHLKEGDPVGFVGDTDSPGFPHLHFEVRRLREGVSVTKLTPAAMIANENSVVCDPRNVLRQRSAP
jgi:murein DD-endopeptidase MepM/ murein hydrolase activator NlpD